MRGQDECFDLFCRTLQIIRKDGITIITDGFVLSIIPPMPWLVSCVTFSGVWLRIKTLRGFPKEKRCRIQSTSRFCKANKPNVQRAAKATPQRMYVGLKNNRLITYRIGIRVKSTVYGSILPIASRTAVTRKGLIPHRYAPRKNSVSFSATAGSRSPST